MLKEIKLEQVKAGENFKVWNHEYTVLDRTDKGVFVLEADAVCEMPFREDEVDYKVAPNDFRDSSVRAYLEGYYLEELIIAGAELDRDILEIELDLKCTLGQHEYGVARVHAGLLTLEQYGKYYDIIPRIDTTYWLATPWKTPSRSTYTDYADGVWSVFSNGSYGGWNYNDSCGVRPALTLNPTLVVLGDCSDDQNHQPSFDGLEPLTLKELKALKEATPLWVLNLTWEQQEPRIMLVRQVVEDWWTCLDFNRLEMFLSKDYGTKYLIYRRLKGKGGLNDGENN